MGFLSGSGKTHMRDPKPLPPEDTICGDETPDEEPEFLECGDESTVDPQMEPDIESTMEAAADGSPDAALFMADIFLDAFAREYPDKFHPRWAHSLDNAKAFCSFYLMAEHFGADEGELRKRMLNFLSHFGGGEDIEYFDSEVYVPLKIQMLAHLGEEEM